ncbi:MAG TPA: hypothetical protein ENO14_01335, partial [Chromatiales bacterium]|nr:hypothetical protein [Chromatiales bacterium]
MAPSGQTLYNLSIQYSISLDFMKWPTALRGPRPPGGRAGRAMPYIDRQTNQIVVRIVYDGPPEAGKTTNLRQLCASMPIHKRGELSSPDSAGRRTEFFDWLDFSGGLVDFRAVRCQLVSVPGQISLLRRRRFLLEAADAVVFVVDSSPDAREDNVRALQALREATAVVDGGIPVGIVLQANKQDAPDAMKPNAVASALGMA